MDALQRMVKEATATTLTRAKRDIKFRHELALAEDMVRRGNDRVAKAQAQVEKNTAELNSRFAILFKVSDGTPDEIRERVMKEAADALAAKEGGDSEDTDEVPADDAPAETGQVPAETESDGEVPEQVTEVAANEEAPAQPQKRRGGRFVRSE